MAYSQESRICSATSPLGKDVLLVQQFSGEEAISRLFRFEIDFLSEHGTIDFKKIIGKPLGIRVELEDGSQRYFHGLVARFSQAGSDRRFVYYRAEMVPWLWCLTRTADCRIFQGKSVPDIAKQVFSDLGFSDVRSELTGSYKPREYCVQYRETDFNFVSRLFEEEGIAYFFEHDASKHTLVLADSPSGYPVCAGQPDAEYITMSDAQRLAGEIETFSFERELHPGKFSINDYNFETPSTSLLASTTTTDDVAGNDQFEIFDFPTDHTNLDEGRQQVRLRMEAEEASAVQIRGTGSCVPFYAGSRFTLKGHYRDDYNTGYLLTSVGHTLRQGVGYEEAQSTYANEFTCIPSSVSYRPPRITRRPVVTGVQAAVVTGPSGEEIYVDKYGRVKVQFYWDRKGKRDQNSSCWVRVSQPIAGKGWGAHYWPRIGQEVIVDFVEGDPDRPIITGRVYNAEQMPPCDLPGSKVQTGIKSRSTPGGGGFNEILMDDSKGKEALNIHAQYDMATTVENDQTTTIKSGKRTVTVQSGTSTETVKGDSTHTVQAGNRKVQVTGGDYSAASTSGAANLTGQTSVNIKGESAGVTIDGNGGPGVKVTGTPTVKIDGTASIELSVGGSSIKISPGGIDIQSPGPVTVSGAVVKHQT